MDQELRLLASFEEGRPRLRAMAYRMLGSAAEADDALQDAWLKASRADTAEVVNPAAWLTTVVSRVCLTQLRSRQTRREEPLELEKDPDFGPAAGGGPEQEAVLADSVGVALLVVLDTLTPAERIAFVLHDLFAVPFEEIAPLVEKSVPATRQLASRARRRVQGREPKPGADPARRRAVVEAFLAATRGGDFEALVALLDPAVELRADRMVVPTPEPIRIAGGATVAQAAMAAMGRARLTGVVLVDGEFGLVMMVQGRPAVALRFAATPDGAITDIDVIAEPARLSELEFAVPAA
ncbi:sigma-70 family RNA polymerase sigma factor [Kitasatospora sp. LaBMicrA B282]|uniref:sigma-70 family RNA polymerase sigma factor n=1 Tax=Kitasatospora sp. LaBMicrA B282 TaxID=3420949 RepID=UPI003D0B5C16